jgi:hypothetical protein
MFPAYSGNSAYCYSNSLHMCLQHAGMPHLPPVSLVECMTGMPFGACFLQRETPLFLSSPASITPDDGLTRALAILGWACTVWRGDEADLAQAAFLDVLRDGPVLLGPLDQGFLPYDPRHAQRRGGDHFIVALKCEADRVLVHDPQLYPLATLPLTDLMRAWYAKDLGYACAYTLRGGFREQRRVSQEHMLTETLRTAQELTHTTPTGPVAYGGAAAFTLAAEVLRHRPSGAFIALLTHFSLPIGARRCLDAAGFLTVVGQTTAARLMGDKAEAFGQAQYYAVQQDRRRTAELFEHLAQVEAQMAQSL